MQAARIGEIVEQRVERAGKPMKKQESENDEPDVPLDRNAEEARAALVLADRDQVRPKGERRMKPIAPTASAKQTSTK